MTAKETRSHKRDVSLEIGKRLFDEPFWPVKRVLAWIAFRHKAGLKASLNAGSEIVARVYGSEEMSINPERYCERFKRVVFLL